MNNSSIEVYMSPLDVWTAFTQGGIPETNLIFLAENTDAGYEVLASNENGALSVYVLLNDEEVCHIECNSEESAVEALGNIYYTYIYTGGSSRYEDESLDVAEALVRNRENELHDALRSFLDIASVDMCGRGFEEDLSDMLDDILDIVAMQYCYPVYRPTIVKVSDGITLVEYPYEEMVN